MIAKALMKYAKISAKKARLVVNLVRGKTVDEALGLLPNINRKASELIEDTLRSAVNNVKVKYPDKGYTDDVLYVSKITADGGPSLVRFRAASMGRASMIRKRTSHILIELDVDQKKYEQLEALRSKQKGKSTSKAEGVSKGKGKKQAVAKGSK